jgi:hypothetical protein
VVVAAAPIQTLLLAAPEVLELVAMVLEQPVAPVVAAATLVAAVHREVQTQMPVAEEDRLGRERLQVRDSRHLQILAMEVLPSLIQL